MNEPKCPRLWLVEAIRDGRVVGVERASFGKHLRGCADCAERAKRAESAREKLKELPSGLPDAFTLRRQRRDLLRTFDASLFAKAPKRRSSAARVVTGLAFAVAGAVGVWLFFRAHVTPSWVEVVAGPEASWSEQKTNSLDRVTLRKGRFNLRIHRPSPSSRVVLSLPDGEIEDLGTVLEVWADGDRTSHVAVRSGEVVLRLRDPRYEIARWRSLGQTAVDQVAPLAAIPDETRTPRNGTSQPGCARRGARVAH